MMNRIRWNCHPARTIHGPLAPFPVLRSPFTRTATARSSDCNLTPGPRRLGLMGSPWKRAAVRMWPTNAAGSPTASARAWPAGELRGRARALQCEMNDGDALLL